jgi:hypothetical protein
MAQPGRAPEEGVNLGITIDANYNASSGSVPNGGTVIFTCEPPNGCYVYTAPLPNGGEAFRFESNNYVTLHTGTNPAFEPSQNDVYIHFCACASTSSPCDPLSPMDRGGYTIKVGNPSEAKDEKKREK